MKEPVELERDEAEAAQRLIASANDPKTPFSIEGVIATKKEDMKFVVFDKVVPERSYGRQVDPMGDLQAHDFELEMNLAKVEAIARGYKDIYWEEFHLEKKGLVKIESYESPRGGKHFTISPFKDRLEDYSLELHRIDCYRERSRRKAWVEKRNMDELQALADSMSV